MVHISLSLLAAQSLSADSDNMLSGIVGFVRFTAGWYAILIKQRAAVGLVGGHYIYHCEESLIMPISSNAKPEKPSEETK